MSSIPTLNNNIRLFISSTFNDMQAERDQLVKKVFPLLRAHCEKAGMTFTEVDLRWGITNEEAAEGKVLSICLEEIQQCRPYFIGILGDRYGWIPDTIPVEVSTSEPWLKHESGKSVTELEILHGVLNNPEMANYAFFYFREMGEDAAQAPHADKLAALKSRIKSSGFPVKEGFTSPSELGQWIEEDLKAAIAPQIEIKNNQHEIVRATQEAGAHQQVQSAFFVKPKSQCRQLDTFVNPETKSAPLLICEGEAGSGKYTTLINWYLQRKQTQRLIFYPTRAGGDFSDVDFMLRYLTYQLTNCKPEEIPSDDCDRYQLTNHFLNALETASANGGCTIIIPSVDQLSDAQVGRGLIWMPTHLPQGIQLIISSSSNDILEELQHFPAEQMEQPRLSNDLLDEFIRQFLHQYRKKLPTELIWAITNSPLATLPINLMIILEELRIFGRHEQLESTLSDYLRANDTKELFMKVIARWERDFNPACADMVKTTLTCIFMTVTGHSEAELREILGDKLPIPHAHWAPFFHAISKWLLRVRGNLKIGNQAFIDAIIEKYLQYPENVITAHQKTAHYFLRKLQNEKPGGRAFTELPYALIYGQDYNGFINFFADRETLKSAWNYSPSLVTQYFAIPEERGLGHFSNIINKEIKTADDYNRLQNEDPDYLHTVALIFQKMGYVKEALMFWNMIAGAGQLQNNDELLEAGLSNMAYMKMMAGETDEAINLYNYLLDHYEQKEHVDGIASSYHNLGLCYNTKNDYEEALEYFTPAMNFYAEEGESQKQMQILHNMSNTMELLDRHDEAERMLFEAETICRQLGDNITLAMIFNEKGTLLHNQEKYDEALALHNQALQIFETLNHTDRQVVALALRGKTHFSLMNVSEGTEDYLKAIQTCVDFGLEQFRQEIIRMLNEALPFDVSFWKWAGYTHLLEELNDILIDYRDKQSGKFDEALNDFWQILQKSLDFANTINENMDEDTDKE